MDDWEGRRVPRLAGTKFDALRASNFEDFVACARVKLRAPQQNGRAVWPVFTLFLFSFSSFF